MPFGGWSQSFRQLPPVASQLSYAAMVAEPGALPGDNRAARTHILRTLVAQSSDVDTPSVPNAKPFALRSRVRKGAARREAKQQRRQEHTQVQLVPVGKSILGEMGTDEVELGVQQGATRTLQQWDSLIAANRVTFVDTLGGVQQLQQELFNGSAAPHGGGAFPWRRLVSLDCEWQPFSHGSSKTHVALLQLAADDGRVWLLDMLALMCPLPNLLGTSDSLQGGNGLCWTRSPSDEEEAVGNLLSALLGADDIVKVGFRLEVDLQRLMESYPIMPSCWGPTKGVEQLPRHLPLQQPAQLFAQAPVLEQVSAKEATMAGTGLHDMAGQAVGNTDAMVAVQARSNAAEPGLAVDSAWQDPPVAAQSTREVDEQTDDDVWSNTEDTTEDADCWLVSQSIEGGAHGGPAHEVLRDCFVVRDLAGSDRLQPWHTVQPVRCVIDAAALARKVKGSTSPQLRRLSLKTLCERELGVVLDKRQQCSDWAARPLTVEQVQYAAEDVLAVVAIADKLVHQHRRMRGLKGITTLYQGWKDTQGHLVSAGSFWHVAGHPSMLPPDDSPREPWITKAAAAQNAAVEVVQA